MATYDPTSNANSFKVLLTSAIETFLPFRLFIDERTVYLVTESAARGEHFDLSRDAMFKHELDTFYVLSMGKKPKSQFYYARLQLIRKKQHRSLYFPSKDAMHSVVNAIIRA